MRLTLHITFNRGMAALAAAAAATALSAGIAFADPDVPQAPAAKQQPAVEVVLEDELQAEPQVVEVGPQAEPAAEAALPALREGAAEAPTQQAGASAIEAYVSRLYNVVLGRAPEPEGFAFWVSHLRNGMSAAQAAQNFFLSDEFAGRGLSSQERVRVAYLTLLNREPEPAGLSYWQSYLDANMTLDSVVCGFANSSEFRGLCAGWGVDPGSVSPALWRDRSQQVSAYVTRLYRLVLGRAPEPQGMEVQCRALLTGTAAGQLALNFFDSAELASRGLTAAQRVRVAYLTMLNREPEPAGAEAWTSGLEAGMTMAGIACGFNNSDEFRGNCAKWGVAHAYMQVSNVRDRDAHVTGAVGRAFVSILNRKADIGGLETFCQVCSESGYAWVCESLLDSSEFTNKNYSTAEKVEIVYQAMLGRSATEAEMEEWVEGLEGLDSVYPLMSTLSTGSEYQDRMKKMGVNGGHLAYYNVSDDLELNMMISRIIETKTGTDLVKIFNYCAHSFTYQNRAKWPSYEGWMEDYAKKFLQDGGGNCYGWACLFHYLAKAAGVDTEVVQGMCGGMKNPHGWCVYYRNGQPLVIDPNLTYELGVTIYMTTYADAYVSYWDAAGNRL